MVNRRIILFGLIVVLGLTVLGIGKNLINDRLTAKEEEIEIIRSDEEEVVVAEEEGIRRTVMYFKDKDGYLVPVMRKIPWEEGIARVTLKNMIDSPEVRETLNPTGLLPIIPAGTEVLGISINDETGVCKVDFSDKVLENQSEKEEENFIKGVVYTLTEFPAIREVQILVGGKVIPSLKHGGDISKPLARENINLVGKLEDGRSKVVVYYKGMNEEEFEYFIPVTVPTLAPVANVYSALDLLFEGPPQDIGLSSDIPRGVMLQGVEVKNGTAYVDISYDNHSDSSEDKMFSDIVKNIGLTLSQFEEINNVELLIDGETINTTIPVFANEY
ncbi:GerMN domain-containing protein [Tissierella praeacuta]|uniref:Germination protein M n=1 Tax=Tissierella praeacuta DSM 18095 TaxID=1123404 RepID=A0A1M4W730_9FIRM|nr:GerMN domain-containing protein [Tissierella praeacuta]MBU5256134.1 GerMN domain-containing protein [Tissierella praeacuta]TCU75591.1 germination protein M [Tissierella praeacuta]SHE76903.1 germination protein M [Tissierella praeacuta DSM 18095]SUP00029.1 Spore germination protein gerM [Tissierella praeacuta]